MLLNTEYRNKRVFDELKNALSKVTGLDGKEISEKFNFHIHKNPEELFKNFDKITGTNVCDEIKTGRVSANQGR